MNPTGIPSPVASFLREHISSLWLLEVLLLLHHEPTRVWSAQTIATELRIQAGYVNDRCAVLAKIGLVKRQGDELSFDATSPLAPVVAQLAETYRTHRVAIIELVFSKPPEASRAFADAFVIKKRGENDG